jgi:hypothetical protein
VTGTAVLDALEQAMQACDAGVPGRVLLRLVALHDSLDAPEKTSQSIDFDSFFVKLLGAADRATRMLLAQHWGGQEAPPRQAMLLLALDRDPAIAAQLITRSKSLTDNDLLEIARRGSAPQWHALADRPALAPILVDFLMVFADEETRTRIKSNPFARWSGPADSLFNRPNRACVQTNNSSLSTDINRTEGLVRSFKTVSTDIAAYPHPSAPATPSPRRDALELATRLALHMLERPSPPKALLAALLTKDLARGHQARLLARLALAADLSAEGVMRGFTASDNRYFATLLWALDIPKVLFDRLIALKDAQFPPHDAHAAALLHRNPLTPAQARQALQFLTRADRPRLKQSPAVGP